MKKIAFTFIICIYLPFALLSQEQHRKSTIIIGAGATIIKGPLDFSSYEPYTISLEFRKYINRWFSVGAKLQHVNENSVDNTSHSDWYTIAPMSEGMGYISYPSEYHQLIEISNFIVFPIMVTPIKKISHQLAFGASPGIRQYQSMYNRKHVFPLEQGNFEIHHGASGSNCFNFEIQWVAEYTYFFTEQIGIGYRLDFVTFDDRPATSQVLFGYKF